MLYESQSPPESSHAQVKLSPLNWTFILREKQRGIGDNIICCLTSMVELAYITREPEGHIMRHCNVCDCVSVCQTPHQAPGQPFKFTIPESLDRIKEEFQFLQAQYHR